MAVLGELRALGLLLADIEQADAGVGDAERGAGVDLGHLGKLQQILGLAVCVGTHVAQYGLGDRAGDDACDAGALDAGNAAHDEGGRRHARAGAACAEEALGPPLPHQAAAHDDAGVLLLAYGVGGVLAHLDDLSGCNGLAALVGSCEGLDHVCRAGEDHLDVRCRGKGLLDAREHDGRGLVAAERVYDKPDHLHDGLLSAVSHTLPRASGPPQACAMTRKHTH